MPRMVQPLRSDERSLPKPVSFRVTQAEQDAIDRCVIMFGLAKEGADLGPHRGEACRRLAAAAVNGAIVADMTDEDRAKLDRLVAAQSTTLARYAMTATRSSVLLSLLREAPEHDAAGAPPPAPDVKAFVAAAPIHETAVREAAAREAAAVTPAPAEQEAPAVTPAPAEQEAPAVTPAAAELHEVDVGVLQEALIAAMNAGETAASIAAELEVSPSAIRGFKSTGKGLGAERRKDLARILREKGHLKDGS